MSQTEQILDRFVQSQGWTDRTVLDLALTYIENQSNPEAWEDYLTSLKEVDDDLAEYTHPDGEALVPESNPFRDEVRWMCGNCRDAIAFDVSASPQVWVGSDGEITCPDTDRLHGPAVPDEVDENGLGPEDQGTNA